MTSLKCLTILIQCQMFKIRIYHKNAQKLPTNPLTHIHINKIDDRLLFKIKGRCKLKLQKPETKKFFGSTKRFNRQSKKWEKY